MTQRDDLDRLLSAWIDDPYTPPAPHYLGRVLERTRHTKQRPAWASLERWLPMADKVLQPTPAPPMRMARLLLVALLVLALVSALAFVGARLLQPTPVIPQGGAAIAAFASFVGDASGQTRGDIYIVRADGTGMRQLTRGPGIRLDPVFSPDGTRIAYRERSGRDQSVIVMDAGGDHKTTLAAMPGICARGSMAWSPDGTSLVFPTSPICDTATSHELFIVATDGSSPATGLLAPGIASAFPDWSPDGRKIAFLGTEAGGPSAVYVADVGPADALAGGLQARRIGPGPGVPLTDSNSGPQWSPDGTAVVASTGSLSTISEPSSIVIMKPDGSEQRVIAEDVGNPMWSPVWAPDGRQLAYVRAVDPSEYFVDRPCTVRAWVIDADGTDARQLDPLAEGCDVPLSWSPDGTRLAMLLIGVDDPNPSFHISMVTIDGSEPTVTLGDGGVGSWQPVAAPLPPAPVLSPAASPSD